MPSTVAFAVFPQATSELSGLPRARRSATLCGVPTKERSRFRVRGVVQGVGFRPFVYGLALRQGLDGFVLNDGDGVVIEAEGGRPALAAFTSALRAEAPPLARVETVTVERLAATGRRGFSIAASTMWPGAR